MLDITPMHGFASTRSGFRTRSLGSGGSFGDGCVAARARAGGVFLPTTISIVAFDQYERSVYCSRGMVDRDEV